MNPQIEITTNGVSRTISMENVVMAAIGAGVVCLAYSTLSRWVGAFTAAIPFIAGGLLFATLVGSFYFLLQFLKVMRKNASLRISFWEGYTAVAIFTVMGYMATACMHAFQPGGNALQTWNNASIATALFATFFGVGRFVADLWQEGDQKKSGGKKQQR